MAIILLIGHWYFSALQLNHNPIRRSSVETEQIRVHLRVRTIYRIEVFQSNNIIRIYWYRPQT
jgi:hypothetical protein